MRIEEERQPLDPTAPQTTVLPVGVEEPSSLEITHNGGDSYSGALI